jgi:hypothetical protein
VFKQIKAMKPYLILLLIFIPLVTVAQDYQQFYEKSLNINQTGMYVLGGWALANIASGAYGWSKYNGPTKYFHQMNLFWNTVNLSIAGIGLYSAISTDPFLMETANILKEQRKTENIYLINAGLDVLYMAGGYYMTHLSLSKTKNRDLLKGYGQSVMLQGAFLFVFDLVMYAIQWQHRSSFSTLLTEISFAPGGVSVVLRF